MAYRTLIIYNTKHIEYEINVMGNKAVLIREVDNPDNSIYIPFEEWKEVSKFVREEMYLKDHFYIND